MSSLLSFIFTDTVVVETQHGKNGLGESVKGETLTFKGSISVENKSKFTKSGEDKDYVGFVIIDALGTGVKDGDIIVNGTSRYTLAGVKEVKLPCMSSGYTRGELKWLV